MYTGTLIEELIATVERVKLDAPVTIDARELECLYAMVSLPIAPTEPSLLGVA